MKETDSIKSKRWRDKHPEDSKRAMKEWRERNKSTMSLLNRRKNLKYKLCIAYVRQNFPILYEQFGRVAKRELPAWMANEKN